MEQSGRNPGHNPAFYSTLVDLAQPLVDLARRRLPAAILAATVSLTGCSTRAPGQETSPRDIAPVAAPVAQITFEATKPSDCAATMIGALKDGTAYQAYQAPIGSFQFGPNQDTTKDLTGSLADFDKHLCTDPLFAATTVEFLNKGDKMVASEVEARGLAYATDPEKAAKETREALSKFTVTKQFIPDKYSSLGMIKKSDPKEQPSLGSPVNLDRAIGEALVFTNPETGEKRIFRIVCDDQPVTPNPDGIPGIPIKFIPGPETPNTPDQPPCAISGTLTGYKWNPETCAFEKTPQTDEVMRDGGTTGAKQPVNNNTTSGINTGKTSGTSTAPKTTTTKPATTTTKAAPPATTGGYDTGSTSTGSAPAGSTTNGGGTTTGESTPNNPPVDTGQGGNNGGEVSEP